jgi:hypothetical protein
MTARQGRWLVLATVVLVTALLLRSAQRNGEWVGFFVTEVQLVIPMILAWKVLREAEAR